MFERGEEITIESKESVEKSSSRHRKQDGGYSEEAQATIIEGTQIDIKLVQNQSGSGHVKKRKPLTQDSRKQKIVIAYQELSSKVSQMVLSLSSQNGENLRQAEHILEDIREIRKLQDEFLKALLLDQKGSLDKSAFSKKAWALIE